jgi:hypothetical protein
MRLSNSRSSSVWVRASRKLATRSKVARQSAMTLKLSTNQRNEVCAWVNAAAAIMSPPNEIFPAK